MESFLQFDNSPVGLDGAPGDVGDLIGAEVLDPDTRVFFAPVIGEDLVAEIVGGQSFVDPDITKEYFGIRIRIDL